MISLPRKQAEGGGKGGENRGQMERMARLGGMFISHHLLASAAGYAIPACAGNSLYVFIFNQIVKGLFFPFFFFPCSAIMDCVIKLLQSNVIMILKQLSLLGHTIRLM